jgi:pyrroline-5-carboxylate reductase
MPNMPALVGESVAAIAGGATADDVDLAWAGSILGSVGAIDRLDGSQFDAFNAVAGSDPASVLLVAESSTAAAIAQRLDGVTAERVVT